MFHKPILTFLVLVLLSMPCFGNSSIVGVWDIRGVITEKVKITGYGERNVKVRGRDVFTFNKDKTFLTFEGIHGRWAQNGANYRVSLYKPDIESLFNTLADEYGLTVLSFKVPRAYITGKVSSKNKSIGIMVLEMRGAVYAFNGSVLYLSVNATTTFSGIRKANPTTGLSANSSPSSASQNETNLTNLIRVTLRSFVEEAEISR